VERNAELTEDLQASFDALFATHRTMAEELFGSEAAYNSG
jgi:hypothetical protein